MSERFIFGGRPELLRALAKVIDRDSKLKLISVAGPADAPERLVASMPAQRAEQFRQTMDGLVVEPDQDLQPFM